MSDKREGIEKTARDLSRSTGMTYNQARERVERAVKRGDRKREQSNR